MANCEECLHYEVCMKDAAITYMFFGEGGADKCDYFKNRQRFVELPEGTTNNDFKEALKLAIEALQLMQEAKKGDK